MAFEVIIDDQANRACFMCNTTGIAFGPVLELPDYINSVDKIEELIGDFVEYLGQDPRAVAESDLRSKWYEFYEQEFGE